MIRSRSKITLLVGAGGLVVLALAFYFWRFSSPTARYLSARVTRGPIVRAVIATGTVNPVVVVQVGSYVSGPIQTLYADFNSPVKQNQLIAKIDPRPFQVKVDEMTAALADAKAQLGKDLADMAYKKLTFERDSDLFKVDAVSQDTLDSARSAYDQAVAQVALDRANIQQQQANLRDAQVQLNYTNIISPVDGTVVSRNVDVGQTVAASFQTPTLFLIAKDLTKMQVDANVSESDIGNLQEGQPADFRVDAFPDRVFEGTVGQVRQAPITVQNVVTYDVVLNVANPELLLKPGMTANVTIVTARRANVLRVPMQALRFARMKRQHAAATDYQAHQAAATDSEAPQTSRRARVYVEQSGRLKPVSIVTGLDDGSNVEVISGDLKPGEMVATEQLGGGHTGPPPSSSLHFPH